LLATLEAEPNPETWSKIPAASQESKMSIKPKDEVGSSNFNPAVSVGGFIINGTRVIVCPQETKLWSNLEKGMISGSANVNFIFITEINTRTRYANHGLYKGRVVGDSIAGAKGANPRKRGPYI